MTIYCFCYHCNKRMKKTEFIKHNRKHYNKHYNDTHKIYCYHCNKNFTPSNYNRHIKTQKKHNRKHYIKHYNDTHKIYCYHCNKAFTLNNYNKHIKTQKFKMYMKNEITGEITKQFSNFNFGKYYKEQATPEQKNNLCIEKPNTLKPPIFEFRPPAEPMEII